VIQKPDFPSIKQNISLAEGRGIASSPAILWRNCLKYRARQWLKKFPVVVDLIRPAWDVTNRTLHGHDIETSNQFPLFAPNSSGSHKTRAEQTILAINQTFPFITRFLDTIGKNQLVENIVTAEKFCLNREAMAAAVQLKHCLDKYGSDKATYHDHHCIYGPILKNPGSVTAVLEIGLGTNNEDVVSNMGPAGSPGASLRAFRDFLPKARIYGADIDRRILFSEDRIETFFADQTDMNSFDALSKNVGADFDLIIDDGLHSPNANIAVLVFAFDKLKPGGWFVVEDIPNSALPVWQVIAALLPAEYKSHLVSAKRGVVFLVERNGRD
jgi:hypothetical protein